jgi:hypothetical protein
MKDIKRLLNGRLNHFTINGIPTSQHYNIENALDKLYEYLSKENINIFNIIEIGTLNGGFTTLLANHKLSDNALIHTFDIADKKHKNYAHSDKIVCYLEDAFETEVIPKILQHKNNCLLFCDGGNKIKEFNIFAGLLKPNDFIFCHDYIKDGETFLNKFKDKIWNWHESNFSSIENAIKQNSLINILPEVFEEVVWSSYRKITKN